MALFTAGLTAFYMFRLLSLTFWGRFRGTPEQEAHVHESPPSMTVPLVVLAFLSVVSGLRRRARSWSTGTGSASFCSRSSSRSRGSRRRATTPRCPLELALMAAAVAVAAVGIYLAWSWYAKGEGRTPARLARAVARRLPRRSPTSTSWTRPTSGSSSGGLALGGGRLLWEVDATVVDLIPNGAAAVTKGVLLARVDLRPVRRRRPRQRRGRTRLQSLFGVFRRAQTGRVQNYALVMGGGLFCLVAVYLLFR